ncbi:MAG: OmpA family protein [Tepidimonas ignava]|uniref:Lipoprotein YiaD n=1 Tax=Tepidimonas ignava TaxID=114249 RepID=A0A4R3LFV4_9BURK|nr:outer membrane protein OmpA-like peptidoglycan-associated protein [Tepidimonas ignava]TSE21837.1 putative lipoprotein YiaD [Tepidimonas ignava]
MQHLTGKRPMVSGGLATAVVLAVLASGCANMSEEQKSGTAKGAMIGAAAGAVLGAVTDGSKGAVRGAAIGAGAGALGGYVWSSRMEQQKREMEAATAGTGVAVTQTADNRLKLEIPSDISFDVGRADIKPNFRGVLDTFADGLKRNPAARVTIIGHTDSTGNDAVNNPLSINRAAAVRDYLVSRGVAVGRIAIDGRGSREPIASNTTPEGRARNRRVEIFVAEQAS